MNAFFYLFVQGGPECMSLITLALVGVLISAWKAPNWVREFGLMGFCIGIFYLLMGYYQAFSIMQQVAVDISPTVFASGTRAAYIAPLYGTLVLLVSLIIQLFYIPRKYQTK